LVIFTSGGDIYLLPLAHKIFVIIYLTIDFRLYKKGGINNGSRLIATEIYILFTIRRRLRK